MRILSKSKEGQPSMAQLRQVSQSTGRLGGIRTLIKRSESKGITQPDMDRSFPPGAKASLTTAFAGADNDLTITANNREAAGNSIRIAFVVSGVSTPLSVSVSGKDITVNVGTNGASAAISTAAVIRDLLNGNAASKLLITAALATGNSGTGVVAALALTNLAGGLNSFMPFAGAGVPSQSSATILSKGKTAAPYAGKRTIVKALAGPLRKR